MASGDEMARLKMRRFDAVLSLYVLNSSRVTKIVLMSVRRPSHPRVESWVYLGACTFAAAFAKLESATTRP